MIKRLSIGFVAVIALSACSPSLYQSLRDKEQDAWRFNYSVSECYGSCATFEMNLASDGTLKFKGIRNTAFLGDTLLNGELAFRDSLISRLENIEFHALDSTYLEPEVQDLALHSYSIEEQPKSGKSPNWTVLKKVRAKIEIPQKLRDFQRWLNGELSRRELL